MIDLKQDFSFLKDDTKKIKDAVITLEKLEDNRVKYLKDLMILLNNNREEWRKIEGLEGYNYANCENAYNGLFFIMFNYPTPTAKGLGVIEDVTGCKFEKMLDKVYWFRIESL